MSKTGKLFKLICEISKELLFEIGKHGGGIDRKR